MTVLTSAIGLLPIMFGTSIGSEVMRRIAAPMVGGLATAAILTLVVIPAIYSIVHGRELPPPRRV
jgi:Cu(I)/Ag(I) efflux system membrane protein CusA/SilA